MSWKLKSEELKQFDAFTSGTSAGSANVTSAHYHGYVSISRSTFEVDIGFAYVVDGSSVLRDLDHLDGNVVADIEGNVRHKRYLG